MTETQKLLQQRLLRRVDGVIQRCIKKRTKGHSERGIRVYEPWLADREAFVAYLMNLPDHDISELELDRINNDGHYEPGNLRFVTRKENQANRRRPGYKPLTDELLKAFRQTEDVLWTAEFVLKSKQRREELKISYTTFAESAGVDVSDVYRLENTGVLNVSRTVLVQLVAAYTKLGA